jgi:hypothetical protein
MHIRQTIVATGMTIRESRVIETQQVQNRRVKIVDVDFVIADPDSIFIGLSVGHSWFHPSAREP